MLPLKCVSVWWSVAGFTDTKTKLRYSSLLAQRFTRMTMMTSLWAEWKSIGLKSAGHKSTFGAYIHPLTLHEILSQWLWGSRGEEDARIAPSVSLFPYHTHFPLLVAITYQFSRDTHSHMNVWLLVKLVILAVWPRGHWDNKKDADDRYECIAKRTPGRSWVRLPGRNIQS